MKLDGDPIKKFELAPLQNSKFQPCGACHFSMLSTVIVTIEEKHFSHFCQCRHMSENCELNSVAYLENRKEGGGEGQPQDGALPEGRQRVTRGIFVDFFRNTYDDKILTFLLGHSGQKIASPSRAPTRVGGGLRRKEGGHVPMSPPPPKYTPD